MNKWIFLFLIICFCEGLLSQENPFALRCGHLQMIVRNDSLVSYESRYFEDWGNLQLIERHSKDSILLEKILIKDGFAIKYYPLAPLLIWKEDVDSRINWLEIEEMQETELNIHSLGEKQMGPYTCMLYSYQYQEEGLPIRVVKWIYKGVTLRSEIEYCGKMIYHNLIFFQDKLHPNRDLFDLPDSLMNHPIRRER